MIPSTNSSSDLLPHPAATEISYEDERGAISLLVWLLGGSRPMPKPARTVVAPRASAATEAHPLIQPAHAS